MKRCFVLGGEGFVGSAVVNEASHRGYEVHAVTRSNYAELKGQPVDLLINANGNSKKFLARNDPVEEFDLSVRSVMRSLHDFKAAFYLHLSTSDVYADLCDTRNNLETETIIPEKISPYGFHKYLAERLVRRYAPDWMILRMGGLVGPGLWKNPIYDLLTSTPLYVHPDSSFQYLHTADLARMVFVLYEKGCSNDIFNVAGDGVVKVREVAEWISDTASRELEGRERTVTHCEINIEKLRTFCPVPSTRNTLFDFIESVLKGDVHVGP